MSLAYARYDMKNTKKLSKHDNFYNNNVNYVLKSSKNNELNV